MKRTTTLILPLLLAACADTSDIIDVLPADQPEAVVQEQADPEPDIVEEQPPAPEPVVTPEPIVTNPEPEINEPEPVVIIEEEPEPEPVRDPVIEQPEEDPAPTIIPEPPAPSEILMPDLYWNVIIEQEWEQHDELDVSFHYATMEIHWSDFLSDYSYWMIVDGNDYNIRVQQSPEVITVSQMSLPGELDYDQLQTIQVKVCSPDICELTPILSWSE